MHLPSIFLSGMSLCVVFTAAAPISSLLSEPALYGPTIEGAVVEKRAPTEAGPKIMDVVVVEERAPTEAGPKIKDVVVKRVPSPLVKIKDVVVEKRVPSPLVKIEDVVVEERAPSPLKIKGPKIEDVVVEE